MADTNIGTAYVKIMPTAKGISGEISKQMAPEARGAGKSAGKNLVGALKGVIAGAAIGKFFKDAINAGGELEQNLGGTEAVFGEFAKKVQKTADDAYKNMGMSASDYMATANKMGSLFQGSGVQQERALELTTKAMQRAADVASVMGLDTSAAMESIAGAAKGNFTMMDNLGVAMNATTLQAYALEKGVNFKWDTASNAEKAELAMQMFMDRTAQYEGNFARESEETFSGSLGAMKSAATNFIATLSLGGDIQKPLGEMVSSAKTFLFNNLFPMVWNILKEIPGIIGSGLKDLFSNLPGMVDAAIGFINNLTENIKNNGGTFLNGLIELVKAGWEALKSIDWLGLGKSLIAMLWEGIKTVAPVLWDGIKKIGETAWNWFKSVDWPAVGKAAITMIGDAIGSLGRLIWDGLSSIGETAANYFKDVDWAEAGANAFHTLVDGLKNIASTLWEAITTIGQTASQHFQDIDWGEAGRNALEGIKNGLIAIGSFLWEAISTIGTKATEFFKNVDWDQAGVNAMTFIINGVKNIATNLWSALKDIATTAGEWFQSVDWKQVGINILNFIINGLKSVGSFLWGALRTLGEEAISGITNIDWAGIGKSIIDGIVNGIKSFGSMIGDAITGAAKEAWNGVKSFLEIGSPSKLMRDTVGKWIPLGIAEGIKQESDSVLEAMDGIAKEASGVNITPTVASPLGAIQGGINNIVNNFYVSGAENPEDFAVRLSRQLKMEMRTA